MEKLKYVALHITKNCSHDCSYCYYREIRLSSYVDKAENDFPLNTLLGIIDELGNNDVEEVYLLGGDPAEHPRFFDIVKYAHGKGLKVTSVSNTHDYQCDPHELSKYLSICESTIHGESNANHDDFCGITGAYDKALTNLRLYHDYGCTTGITINVMPENSSLLYSFVENINRNYGDIVEYINIQRIAPHGRANKNDDYYLRREQVLNALSQIDKISSDLGIEIQCEDAFPLCILPKNYWKYVHKCEWGFEKLSINGDGNVSRCGADPRYNLGNILELTLEKIWKDSPLLNEFRRKEFLNEKCHKCTNLSICGGGCMLGAWSGGEFGTDYLLAE